MPHGYEVVIFEQNEKPGGLMRTNIPAFRLPAKVLDDETGTIINMGVDIRRYNTAVKSMKALLDEKFGCGFSSRAAARLAERNSIFPDATTPTVFILVSTGWNR